MAAPDDDDDLWNTPEALADRAAFERPFEKPKPARKVQHLKPVPLKPKPVPQARKQPAKPTREPPPDRPVAPERDFTRVANSIVREAVPAGLFTGKGKQLYDYLYQQTRGAIVPARSVRLPVAKVMRGAGMSRPTFRAQLAKLIGAGLIEVEERGGDHLGNVFTVFLPEERGYPGKGGNPGNPGKKLDGLPGQDTYPGKRGLNVESKGASIGPNTSYKTNALKDDDEMLAIFEQLNRALFEVSRELTGRAPVVAEAGRWAEVAEVLVEELRRAAGNASGVSSVPAFLATHLRGRLAGRSKPESRVQAPATPVTAIVPPTPEEVAEFERNRVEVEGTK